MSEQICHACEHEEVCCDVEKYCCDICKHYLKERPHGEWKRISIDKYIRHASCFYRCSVCGEDIIGETNFCPNCGSDNRKRGEAE